MAVGLCMQTDEPTIGVAKQLSVQFMLAWTPEEFRECVHTIAKQPDSIAPLVTGRVGLDETAHAFDELATPDHPAKIVVMPSLH